MAATRPGPEPSPPSIEADASRAARLPTQGYWLLAGLTLFWGLNFPAMKVVLNELEPWTFRSVCLGAGGLGLLALCKLSGMSLAVPRADRRPLVWAALFNITGWHLASAFGLSLMEAGRAMILAYTMPLWASVLGVWLLRERLSARRAAGLALGVGGILVLLAPQWRQVTAAPAGVTFILAAAWCWGAGTVLVKRGPWHMPMLLVTAWMFVVGGLPVVAGALFLGRPEELLALSGRAWLVLAYVIALPIMFCHWSYYHLVSIFPVSLASLGMLAAPLVGVLAAARLLGEPLGAPEAVSLAMVVAALALVLIRPR
jgi:drug/metabolite transporter (DMT)-like permease